MPYKIQGKVTQLRCSECGKIIPKEPIQTKTCCINKPAVFCSKTCLDKWERRWLRNQEQLLRRRMEQFKRRMIKAGRMW